MNIFFSKPNKLIVTLDPEDYQKLLDQNEIMHIRYNHENYIHFSIIKSDGRETLEKKEYKENGDFVLRISENKLPSHIYPSEIQMPENKKKINFFVIKRPDKKITKNNNKKNDTVIPESKPISPNYKNIKKFLKKKKYM